MLLLFVLYYVMQCRLHTFCCDCNEQLRLTRLLDCNQSQVW